jgi:BirA family biotin operon repressor/biotin-[acetyl-CoA-carboxylase] ligase
VEHRPIGLKADEILVTLENLRLGGLRVFQRIASTNNEAMAWASEGASDLSLVVSDEQTAGRGRAGRKWHTPAGLGLAFSIILRHSTRDEPDFGRMAGLGALAVAEACEGFGIQTEIKWPNDVLVRRRKVAGILVEAAWSGNNAEAYVIGVGINVLHGSIPAEASVSFPATSIEAEIGHSPTRLDVLQAVVRSLVAWRGRMYTQEFILAWESRLAFRGERVNLARDSQTPIRGTLLGLMSDGRLRLSVAGDEILLSAGELHLYPTNDKIG